MKKQCFYILIIIYLLLTPFLALATIHEDGIVKFNKRKNQSKSKCDCEKIQKRAEREYRALRNRHRKEPDIKTNLLTIKKNPHNKFAGKLLKFKKRGSFFKIGEQKNRKSIKIRSRKKSNNKTVLCSNFR